MFFDSVTFENTYSAVWTALQLKHSHQTIK